MLDDLISGNNPVKVIDAFVDNLNLVTIGFKNAELDINEAGRPCYSPSDLLKLYIYGYFKKVRSSRRLMELCVTNIEVMWMMGKLEPDFRTIADFRTSHEKEIKQVFKTFTKICAELGLYNKEIGVQDGSKFRAANSKDNNFTENKLKKRLELAEKEINRYLDELEKNDAEESDSQKYTKEEIEKMIKALKERKIKYEELQKKMNEEGVSQISFTDPESRLMKTANGGFDVCYNVQTIVDPQSHLIGGFQVTNQCNDLGLMSEVTAEVKETLGIDVMEVPADTGYEDMDDMQECLMNGTIPHVPSKSGKDSYEFVLDYKEAEITEELVNSTSAENIKTCLEAGVLPNAYKDKGIEISVEEVDNWTLDEECVELSFTLNEEGTAVICPNNSELNRVSRLHNRGRTRFASRSACQNCLDKCTTSRFKQVDMKDGQTVLTAKKHRKIKRVIMKLKPDKEKIRKRKSIVEHPFGTIKRWQDGAYVLLKGIKKVSAELALSFLTYNIKRVINMIGVQSLIAKMKEIVI
jgi:transposase